MKLPAIVYWLLQREIARQPAQWGIATETGAVAPLPALIMVPLAVFLLVLVLCWPAVTWFNSLKELGRSIPSGQESNLSEVTGGSEKD